MAGPADLCAALVQLAEDEPDLCWAFVEFLRAPSLYGKLSLNRGGNDIQWEITQSTKRKKLTLR